MDVETFLCQSRKKISFSKINLLNLGKNLVGPWGSTQLGERSPKPVSPPKSDTRKVSPPSSPQNRPTCTCTPVPRASARTSPLIANLFSVAFEQARKLSQLSGGQIFGAGGALGNLIQKKNREKRRKERKGRKEREGENSILEDPMFLFNY